MTDSRDDRRAELYGMLGELPERERRVAVEVVGESRREAFVSETLILDLNGLEPVPAYFVRPLHGSGPFPAMLYNHAHGGDYIMGKDELLVGRSALQVPPYAVALAEQGYCAMCVDHWAFGERRGRTESEIFKQMLWQGRVMWGMMVFDSLKALDYLCSRPDVDAARVGTLGLSMGSTMAWWAAALDTRLKVCVDICCLTEFQALIDSNGLDGHGVYYYVPGLLRRFTTAQINELIIPRSHLSLAGNYDSLTPPAGLTRLDRELRRAYGEAGAADAWKLLRYDIGHFETAAIMPDPMVTPIFI